MMKHGIRRVGLALLLLPAAALLAWMEAHGGVSAQVMDVFAADPNQTIDDSFATADLNNPLSRTWPSAGHDLLNTRNQPNERRISRRNVGTLTPKWVFRTEGDVWVTPAVAERVLYVPDSAGNLFAIQRSNGQALWQRKISDYTGVANDISRTTPAITGRLLIAGNQGGRQSASVGASVFAVNRETGDKLWSTVVETHPTAVITQSPIVYRETIYVGVSSMEEQYAATVPNYPCCSFRGSMVALDRRSGRVLWQAYMQPGAEAPGYAGAAVWGSTAVVDTRRNSLYLTTGNNYTVPQGILDCQGAGDPAAVKACVDAVPGSSKNYFDAVVALDLRNGAVKWARPMITFDSWNIACIFAVPGNADNCTSPKGEDYDFGQGATLFTINNRKDATNGLFRGGRDLLGAGQKSGMYWALNPDDGSVVWNTQVGPGGSLGGFEWGSATDGVRIYGAISNNGAKPYTLPDGTQVRNGSWSALDVATGRILWQTAGTPPITSTNQGAVTVANGVVYAGTIDRAGTMYAFDAATGKILWTYLSGGSVNSGPAVVDGTVYWGSGYGVRGIGISPNNRLYAFVPSADCGTGCGGSGGSGGTGGTGGSGGTGGTGGTGGPLPTTWTGIYNAYFASGTVGRCAGCHNGTGRVVPLHTADLAYQSLVSVGQLNGTASPLAQVGASRLSWFGGDMPPNGPSSAPEAAQAIRDWVAAGAPQD